MSHFERNELAAAQEPSRTDASQALYADSGVQNPFSLSDSKVAKPFMVAWNDRQMSDTPSVVSSSADQSNYMNNRQDQIAQQAQNTRVDSVNENANTNNNRLGVENNPNQSNVLGVGIDNSPTNINRVGIENNPTNTNRIGIDNSPTNTLNNRVAIENAPQNTLSNRVGIDTHNAVGVGVDAHSGSSSKVGDVSSASVSAGGSSNNVYQSSSKSYLNSRGESLPGNQCQTLAMRADGYFLGSGGGIGFSNSSNKCIEAIAEKVTCDAPAALAAANERNSAAAQSWLSFVNDRQRAEIINHGIKNMQRMSDNATKKSTTCASDSQASAVASD